MLEEDDELSSEDPDVDEDGDADDIEEQEAALAPDDEDDPEDASLDELLAQRAAGRKPADESENAEDIMALSSEKDNPAGATLPNKVLPIKDREEFVCRSCFLVKARSQLADPDRMFCRDCA